jgi:hypothetical protein
MHVSRLGPDFSINILQLSPVMQAALPVCGILSLLDNLKIDMIYGMKETNGYKYCQEIMYSFKAVRLLQGRPVSREWQRRHINGHLIRGDIRKL